MLTKLLKLLGLTFLMAILTGCPGEEDCYDYGATARIDNLISVSPLLSQYNLGDIITYKTEIPSQNGYFNTDLNLFENTKDYNARLYTNPVFFEGNTVAFIKGSFETKNGWINVVYNPDNQKYELEIEIKLQKKGEYSIISGEYIEFKGSAECNIYRLDTNIAGRNTDGKIEFTVK